MTFIYPADQTFDCGSCTKCCRGAWNIQVDPASYERVRASALFSDLAGALGAPPVQMVDEGTPACTAVTLKGAQGCVFLREDNLCGIHRDLGIKAKPLTCRQFPFILKPTPEGVVVGVSFFCSAVQRGEGRPLQAHEAELAGLVREYRQPGVGHRPISLHDKVSISWKAYRWLEEIATSALGGPSLRDGLWQIFLGTGLSALCLLRAAALAPRLATALTPTFTDADLDQHLRALPPLHVERDTVFRALERHFLLGVIGALESSDTATCRANTDALHEGGTLQSGTFARPIDVDAFKTWRQRLTPRPADSAFKRYFDHLLFRKFLAADRSVLANAAALWLLLPLLEWYRDVSAFVAGRNAPSEVDVHRALDVAEMSFATHARGMDPFFDELSRAMIAQLQKLVPTQPV